MEKVINQVKSMAYEKPLVIMMPIIVCLLAATFHLYDFILQVSAGVMTSELMRDLSIDARGLGIVAAFYYYAYTPMQIPAGLLYDRYGPRVLLTFATLVCVAGAYFFGYATTPALAAFGRFCMGIGSAFAFIGALVLVSRWFSAVYFALMAGIVQFMSSIGAMLGEAPLAKAVSVYGWRDSILWLATAGLFLAAVIYCVIRDYPAGKKPAAPKKRNGLASEWQRLTEVFTKPQARYVAIYSFFIWGPILCFGVLWGVPFLAVKYTINHIEAGAMIMSLWMGVAIASPLAGFVSNYIERRNVVLGSLAILGIFSSGIVIYGPVLPTFIIYSALFLFGFSAGGQSLAFGVINDFSERHLIGTAIGFNNMAVVAGGAIFQPLIGFLLKAQWDGKIVDGVASYSVEMFQHGMLLIPLCYVGCIYMTSKRIKETYCQPVYLKDKKYVHLGKH